MPSGILCHRNFVVPVQLQDVRLEGSEHEHSKQQMAGKHQVCFPSAHRIDLLQC